MSRDRTSGPSAPSWYATQALGSDRDSYDRHAEAATVYRTLFEDLMENLPWGLAVIDRETGRVIRVNMAMLRIMEAPRDELVGSLYLDCVAPEDRARVQDYYRRRILGDPTLPKNYEMLMLTWGGERRVVDFHVDPVRFSDVLIVLMRDLTEEKLFHEPLVHIQKMEGMSALVGRISHEFNNLLASVLGHASILHKRVQGDAEAESLTRRIEQAAGKTRDVLGQLLELGGGRGAFFDRIAGEVLADRLEQVIEGIRGFGEVEISFEASKELWPIRGDLNLLIQAILEVVHNALDALDGSGRIRIVIENRGVDETKDVPPGLDASEVVAVVIEDDGPGIPMELRRRVVEPYFTTRDDVRHDGLGLTKVFNAVREFDGALDVGEAAIGGARLTLFIPRGPDPSSSLPAVVESESDDDEVAAEPLVLVVDDKSYIGEMIVEMLEPHGIRVRNFSNPKEGLDEIRRGDLVPDVLIVDARMPGMDGRELTLAVREILAEVPILMISGYTGASVLDDEAARELSGFIKKPFSVDTLLKAVLPLLGKE